MGAISFPCEMTPLYVGGTNKHDRVTSPEGVPIQLNVFANSHDLNRSVHTCSLATCVSIYF